MRPRSPSEHAGRILLPVTDADQCGELPTGVITPPLVPVRIAAGMVPDERPGAVMSLRKRQT